MPFVIAIHGSRQGECDIVAAERNLGYRPEWELERGIRDCVSWRGVTA